MESLDARTSAFPFFVKRDKERSWLSLEKRQMNQNLEKSANEFKMSAEFNMYDKTALSLQNGTVPLIILTLV